MKRVFLVLAALAAGFVLSGLAGAEDYFMRRAASGLRAIPGEVVETPEVYGSCRQILDAGQSTGSGTYSIDPDGDGGDAPFDVYCDMSGDGGGWTLVLRGKGGNTGTGWGTSADYQLANAATFDDTFKFSDTRINQLRGGGIYRLTGDGSLLTATYFVSSGCLYSHTTQPGDGFCSDSWTDTALTSGAKDAESGVCSWHMGISNVTCGSTNTGIITHHNDLPGTYPNHWTKATGASFCRGTESGCNIALWVREPAAGASYRQNCLDILNHDESTGSGAYLVDPDGNGSAYGPFKVMCDMTTGGGGWTLVARGLGGDTEGWDSGASAQLSRAQSVGGTFKFGDGLLNTLRAGGVYRVVTSGFFATQTRYFSTSCTYAHMTPTANGACSDSWADAALSTGARLFGQTSCPWHLALSDGACDGGGPSPNIAVHHDDNPSTIPNHWATSPDGTSFCRGTQANCNLEVWVR